MSTHSLKSGVNPSPYWRWFIWYFLIIGARPSIIIWWPLILLHVSFLIFRILMMKLTIRPTLTRFFGSQLFTVLLHWPLWLSATQWFATKSGKVIYLWNSKEFELSTSTKTRYICDMYILCKEIEIIHRFFLVNCYLLHVPRLPFQPASNIELKGLKVTFFQTSKRNIPKNCPELEI